MYVMDYHHHTNNSFDSNAVMEDMQGDVRFKTSEKVHLTSKEDDHLLDR